MTSAGRPDVQLLLNCVRLDAAADGPPAGIADIQDWNAFLLLANAHRVVAPVAARLAGADGVPPAAAAELARMANQVAVWNLHQTRLLLDLLREFSDAGVRAMPIKGPMLAERLYGGVAARQFRDLDILVEPEAAPACIARLEQRGFEWTLDVPPAWRQRYLHAGYDAEMHHASELVVELHWGLLERRFGGRRLLERAWANAVPESLMGQTVEALHPGDELAYLLVHGAKHRWRRLQWLLDVARAQQAAPDTVDLVGDAQQLGLRRRLALHHRLAGPLVGFEPQDRMRPRLRPREARVVEQMAREIIADLHSGVVAEPQRGVERRYHLQAFDRPSQRTSYLARHLLVPTPADWAALPLPPAAAPVYYAVRPVRLAAAAVRGALSGRGA